MNVVFFGTPALAVPSLKAVSKSHNVMAVVCQPDRPKGRGKKLEPPPVKVWAEANGLPVHQPRKLNDGRFAAWLLDMAPDVCAIAAYGRLLKQPILDIPKHGFINMHPSLLPKYRGPSPIQSAVLAGETITGVSIMRLTLEMDAGDIILQREAPIGPDENAAELSDRLAPLGGELLAEALDQVEAGTAAFTPQDHAQATYCRILTKEDGRIRWEEPASNIHNLVRGAHPWPIAYCTWQGQQCRIHKTQLLDELSEGPPGEITHVGKDRVHVATGRGQVAVLVFQAPGKRALPMDAFLRGARMQPGDRFEDG